MLRPEGEGGDAREPSPSPSRRRRAFDTTWGGVRGGGNPDVPGSAIPPSLSLPHEGGGDAVAAAEPDPEGLIWRGGAFHADAWQAAPEDGALPDEPIIVSKKHWLAARDALLVRTALLGLRLESGEDFDDLAGDVGRFGLIALSFPKFSDGRAFSTARLLREKYGFAGELRAVGNVLADQIPFMRRVGFDSYEVNHLPTRKALIEGRIAEVTLSYQPGERGSRRD